MADKTKLCPFRKTTVYNGNTNYDTVDVSAVEDFLPCIGEECAAYYKNMFLDTDECRLLER